MSLTFELIKTESRIVASRGWGKGMTDEKGDAV
jgi:hypothetical protein